MVELLPNPMVSEVKEEIMIENTRKECAKKEDVANFLSREELRDRGFDEDEELLLPMCMEDSSDDEPQVSVSAGATQKQEIELPAERIKEILYGAPAHAHAQREVHKEKQFFEQLRAPPPAERDLERVDYKSLTREAFEEKFCALPAGRPCILTGVAEAEGWPIREKWTDEKQLLKEQSGLLLPITELFPVHGMGKAQKIRLPLKHYAEYARENTVDFPYYPWERDFPAGEWESILKDFAPPSILADDLYDLSDETRSFFPFSCHRFIIIGGIRTGAAVHQDPKCSGAWNTALLGHKRWVLFPPSVRSEELQNASANSDKEGYREIPPSYWWLDVYQKLIADPARAAELGMLEVIQGPLDTIFVPPNWWHAVINLPPEEGSCEGPALTAACTQNCLTPAMLPLVWKEICTRWPDWAHEFSKLLCDFRPELSHLVQEKFFEGMRAAAADGDDPDHDACDKQH
eukprot:gnl/MRDRNA2_/MRDRNA2_42040_c0_seq1.p1 gnl/MRDRNA2_/MRDRNA2_42040_c0~~gnl/MRDRNA2_/MRDRNA2_42040_c0_seq1.p1  ORF type:complete len:461 (+),score=114.76 gnl/MRDRNA2_/MRDRNA2_42040_c0_seq1:31-1413(+)